MASNTEDIIYRVKPKTEVKPKMITICNKCHSSDFSYSSFQREDYTNCKNCGLSDTDTLYIPETDKYKYPMKSRDDVNPKMIHICAICYSPDFKYEDHQFESYQFCNNCGECNGERLYVKESQVRR